MDLVGGAMDPRGGYVSKLLHVKTKESRPVGGACAGRAPLDPPMMYYKGLYSTKVWNQFTVFKAKEFVNFHWLLWKFWVLMSKFEVEIVAVKYMLWCSTVQFYIHLWETTFDNHLCDIVQGPIQDYYLNTFSDLNTHNPYLSITHHTSVESPTKFDSLCC